MKVRDINLVINSHEHCDHIGANRYFQEPAMIAAYRLAASKMIAGDYYVTMYKGNDLNELPMRVHLWLENMTRIDLGNYSLRVFHTPGHTSGCISIIETTCGLLFSADSVFAGGTLSYIAESGSIGDYLDSLARLRCFALRALYPGHGKISTTPMEDIDQAILNAQKVLDRPGDAGPQIFFQKCSTDGVRVGPRRNHARFDRPSVRSRLREPCCRMFSHRRIEGSNRRASGGQLGSACCSFHAPNRLSRQSALPGS